MRIHSITALGIAFGAMMFVAPAFAQDYYEDDIYYNPAKEVKQVRQPAVAPAAQGTTRADGAYYVDNSPVDYPGSDSYTVPAGSLDMDVDTYNRHGQFLVADTVAGVSRDAEDSFAYTRRIERFYNPDVVEGSSDAELADYYYSEQPATNINVYVVDTYPMYSPYYYYSPWRYRYGWYSPYYWDACWGWDPYWSFSWGWGPYWSYSWGWGPAWGHHHWGPAPVWGAAPGHGWRPSTPGASRPHRPAYAGSGASSVGGRRPSSMGASQGTLSRPGNMGRGRYTIPYSGSTTRPASSSTQQQTTARPGNSGRGRSNATQQSSSSRTTNRNSYSTPSRSTNNSGSYRSGGGGGGGSHRSTGGGGGGRGRR